MGKGFGELYKLHGITQYRLSSFEQRPFAKVLSHGVPNTVRRFSSSVLYVVPPLALAYLAYDQIEKRHHHYMRKNPKEFEDDK